MKFIRDILSRKSAPEVKDTAPSVDLSKARSVEKPEIASLADTSASSDLPKAANLKVVAEGDAMSAPVDEAKVAAVAEDKAAEEILQKINEKVSDEAGSSAAAAPVNIWDIDGDDAADAPAPAATPSPRRRRNQTRLLGFDSSADNVVSAFDKAEKVAPTQRAKFPVGWVLVSDGPGRGECFTLEAGMSQIGRAEDQAIQLDFGDNSVSRVNHAAVVYDAETHTFMLGHGGKKNIVRLNGQPVISNEEMKTGDEIKIGETTLRFVALCTDEFNWAENDDGSEEKDDVAIA